MDDPLAENDENPLFRGLSPRADDGIRTRDPHLGKVMLYQLSHVRDCVGKITSGPDGPDSQPRWSGGRRSTVKVRIPSSSVHAASPMSAKSM